MEIGYWQFIAIVAGIVSLIAFYFGIKYEQKIKEFLEIKEGAKKEDEISKM